MVLKYFAAEAAPDATSSQVARLDSVFDDELGVLYDHRAGRIIEAEFPDEVFVLLTYGPNKRVLAESSLRPKLVFLLNKRRICHRTH